MEANMEPTRQVHLDFHTSELIPDIGAGFTKEQFQEALRVGNVNLINVFAKCHHGWSYYPTKIGLPHPYLKIDLLGQQIEACHEIDVAAPIYYTMGWSANDAEMHPEWCVKTESGAIGATSWDVDANEDTPKPFTQWKHLCPSGEYHEHIMAQTEEICKSYDVDGFWYDIYQAHVKCYCDTCRKGMANEGFDVANEVDVVRYRALTIQRHCEDIVPLIKGFFPEASIYFNGLTTLDRPENRKFSLYQWNTKNDLEDLPTTWGGYDKFPIRAKWFLKEEKPIVAMSGKFHTSWGEFGGFKDPQAIKYEAASMIAFGSSCNFGDQLHPYGVMDMTTYENIGYAYDYVKKIEHLGVGGRPAASLGLAPGNDLRSDEGVARMLLEEQIDFDVVRSEDELGRFSTIILPSVAGAAERFAGKLEDYLAGGGSLLILGEGLLDGDKTRTILDAGVKYLGPAGCDIDYTVVNNPDNPSIPASPFLNYKPALRLGPSEGTEVLAAIREPYFSRTYGAYCGHRNTPYKLEDALHPAITRSGNVIVAAHDLDKNYYDLGAVAHRSLFISLLKMLHKDPMVEVDLPSAGRISLLHFQTNSQYVLHMLYAPPLERGECSVIEDLPVIRDVPVRLRLPEEVNEAVLEPAGHGLDLQREVDGSVQFVVPELSCHAAIRLPH